MTLWQVSWLGVDHQWRCSDVSLPAPPGAVTEIVSATTSTPYSCGYSSGIGACLTGFPFNPVGTRGRVNELK